MIYQIYRENAAGEEKLVTMEIEVNHIDSDGYVDLDDAVVTEVEDNDSTIPGAIAGAVMALTEVELEKAKENALDEAEKKAKADACDGEDEYDDMPYSERYNLFDDGPMHYAGLRPDPY